MKKIISIIVSLSIALSLNAQNYKNEIAITYGQFTVPQFAYVMGGIFGVAFTAGHFTFENTKFIGTPGIEYDHYVNDWFGFGGTIICDYITSDTYSVSSEGEKTYNGKWNFGFLSIMPNVKFAWGNKLKFFNHNKVCLYSKLAVGPALALDNGDDLKNSLSLAAQITPLGIDFGNNSVRGYIEAGIGMQGIVTGGIKKLF